MLPANVRLDWKVIASYKHSSLFGLVISNGGKKFYNIDTRPPWRRWIGCPGRGISSSGWPFRTICPSAFATSTTTTTTTTTATATTTTSTTLRLSSMTRWNFLQLSYVFYGGSFKPSIARFKERDSLNREFAQTTQIRWFFRFVLDRNMICF